MKHLVKFNEMKKIVNKMYIYYREGNRYAKYAIIEQKLNGETVYPILEEQGDNDFWFMEDSTDHPDIDTENWFSSHSEAKSYLENYIGGDLILLGEEDTILNWEQNYTI